MNKDEVEMKYYLREKAQGTLEGIADVIEDLNEVENSIPTDFYKNLKAGLEATLHDATKTIAYLCDSLDGWSWNDRYLILARGREGLDEVLYKYGCIPEPLQVRQNRERPQFVSRVLSLSKEDARESRRAIYTECERFGNAPLVNEIRDLLEGVTQNTKEWRQFQQEIEQLLSLYSEERKRYQG